MEAPNAICVNESISSAFQVPAVSQSMQSQKSQLFFSASLRLKAWMEMIDPGVMFFSSSATSTGEEMCQ
jgi:hypothetical protein